MCQTADGCGVLRLCAMKVAWEKQNSLLLSFPCLIQLPEGPPEAGRLDQEGMPALTAKGLEEQSCRSRLYLSCVILLETIKEMDVQIFFFRKQIWLLSQLKGNLKRFQMNIISLLQPTYTGNQIVFRPDSGSGFFVGGYLSKMLDLMTCSGVLCLISGLRVQN